MNDQIIDFLRGKGQYDSLPLQDFHDPHAIMFASQVDVDKIMEINLEISDQDVQEYDKFVDKLDEILTHLVVDQYDVNLHVDKNLNDCVPEIIDAAYGIVVQWAAKNKVREDGLEVGLLTFMLEDTHKDPITLQQFTGEILMGCGLEMFLAFPRLVLEWEKKHGDVGKVLESLKYFLPVPNAHCILPVSSSNLIEDATVEGLFDTQTFLNYDTGFSGRLGWHKLACLVNQHFDQDLYEDKEARDVFSEYYSIITDYIEAIFNALDGVAKKNCNRLLKDCRRYI